MDLAKGHDRRDLRTQGLDTGGRPAEAKAEKRSAVPVVAYDFGAKRILGCWLGRAAA